MWNKPGNVSWPAKASLDLPIINCLLDWLISPSKTTKPPHQHAKLVSGTASTDTYYYSLLRFLWLFVTQHYCGNTF